MPPVTRRLLIQTGAAGSALLALASCARSNAPFADGGYRYRVLTAGDRELIAAVAGALLIGVLPEDAAPRHDAVLATVRGADAAVAGLPPRAIDELRQLFALLEFPPTRGFVAGVWTAWPQTAPETVARFLTRWRYSGSALQRSGYQALHQVVMAAWYGNASSWSRIGYPGPPQI